MEEREGEEEREGDGRKRREGEAMMKQRAVSVRVVILLLKPAVRLPRSQSPYLSAVPASHPESVGRCAATVPSLWTASGVSE